MTNSRPFLKAIVATILLSLSSVWLTTFFMPGTVIPEPFHPSSRHFQISPVPPGGDWTS
jgi:hypothetical protein